MVKVFTYLVEPVFTYCTDFMINLANLTGLSYYEVNTLVFCLAWPILTASLFVLLIVQKRRLKQIRNAQRHNSEVAGQLFRIDNP